MSIRRLALILRACLNVLMRRPIVPVAGAKGQIRGQSPRVSGVTSRFPPRVLGVIALGGVLGSLARYAIAEGLGADRVPILVATLIVNVVGALAIGFLFPYIRSQNTSPLLQPFLITGVLGGFTTFSAFAAEVVVTSDGTFMMLGYIAVTLIAGLLAVPLGLRAFQVTTRKP
jgi:CrcB protein